MTSRRARTTASIAIPVVVALASFLPASGSASAGETGPDRSIAASAEQITLIGDDAFVARPSAEPAYTTASTGIVRAATDGFALLPGTVGYGLSGFTIFLVDSPGIEIHRGSVTFAAAQISAETGLSIAVADGVVADHDERPGEILVRVASDSSCGPLSSPGVVGCGGPRTLGALIYSGEVSLAPQLSCESVAVSVVAHELGHAFGLAHSTASVDGLLQLMYPTTTSGAPGFRAGDRAGLRALAGRPSAASSIADATMVAATSATDRSAIPTRPNADPVPPISHPVTATAAAGSLFSQPAVTRVLDTRNGLGSSGAFSPGEQRSLDLTSTVGSTQVDAVVLNLTVTSTTGTGYVTAFPNGSSRPDTSSANYGSGADSANLVIVKLGPGNTLGLYNDGGSTHLVADLFGVFGPTGTNGYVPATPARILDTRESAVPGERGFPLGCEDWKPVDNARLTAAGVPLASTAAEVVNITAANSTAAGFVSLLDRFAFPRPGQLATTSNLNVGARDTRANLAITPGRDWLVQLSRELTSDVVVDVSGWFVPPATDPTASRLLPVDPSRVLDTRRGIGLTGRFRPGESRTLSVPDAAGIRPEQVTAVVLNVTVVGPDASGYLTVSPTGVARPNASNVNYDASEIVPNLVIAKVGAGGQIDLFTDSGSPDVVADVMGYFIRP